MSRSLRHGAPRVLLEKSGESESASAVPSRPQQRLRQQNGVPQASDGCEPKLHSIEMLRAEHVNCCTPCTEGEVLAQSLLRGEKVPAEALSALTRFFEEYAGERHAAKIATFCFLLSSANTGLRCCSKPARSRGRRLVDPLPAPDRRGLR